MIQALYYQMHSGEKPKNLFHLLGESKGLALKAWNPAVPGPCLFLIILTWW